MSDTLRDGRKPGFGIIDNELIDQHGAKIGVYGVAVYCLLARYAGSGETSFPSYQTIAEKLNFSKRKAFSTIETLIANGLIARTKRSKPNGEPDSNLYTLLDLKSIKTDAHGATGVVHDVQLPIAHGATGVVHDVQPNKTQLEKDTVTKIARAPQPPTNAFDTPLDDPRISLDALPDVQPRSQSKPREVNEGQAPPGQLVKRGTGVDAYWIFREYFPQTLTNRQMEMVRETVTDLTRWRAVCERWAEVYGNDWRKFGLLDWYRNGIPEEKGTHHEQRSSNGVHRTNHQAGAQRAPRPHYANYDDPGYDEERANELNGWA